MKMNVLAPSLLLILLTTTPQLTSSVLIDLNNPFPQLRSLFSMEAMRTIFECKKDAPKLHFQGPANQEIICEWLRTRGPCTHVNAIHMREATTFDLSLFTNLTLLKNMDNEERKAHSREMFGALQNASALHVYHMLYGACEHWEGALECMWRRRHVLTQRFRICNREAERDDEYGRLKEGIHSLPGKGPIPKSLMKLGMNMVNKIYKCVRNEAERLCPGANDALIHEMRIANFYYNLTNYADLEVATGSDYMPRPLPDTPIYRSMNWLEIFRNLLTITMYAVHS